jgi:magnesium chelatase accessory protein
MSLLPVKPDWHREGRDWPNRAFSRFVQAGGLTWHVQVMGEGPAVLLLHGAGAATHSWRDFAPLLARDFTVIAPDLPGHGFTGTPSGDGLSLPGMAAGVQALLAALDAAPVAMVGHSAGAAIAIRAQLDGRLDTSCLISLNGALQPFPGAAGRLFPALAKLLFLNPLANQLFAWRAASPGAVSGLLESTGSTIDARGLALYARLFRCTGHIDGALGMMARWNLEPLLADLPRLDRPLTLISAARDLAVPPSVALAAQALAPASTLIALPDLGHLAHEEDPGRLSALVRQAILA